MTAFDTDVLSLLTNGSAAHITRANAIPLAARRIPVVAAAEVMRGRLAAVRMAEASRGAQTLPRALLVFGHSLRWIGAHELLPYTAAADALFVQWRAAKIRVGSNDLRIAAIAAAHGATLVTRNARDFAQIPGLTLDVWN